MSSKISSLPAASAADNADFTIWVSGGVDQQITRPLLLTAKAGQDINVVGNSSQGVYVTGSGQVSLQSSLSQRCFIVDASGNAMGMNGSGLAFIDGTDTSGAFSGGFTDFIAAFFRMAVAVKALQGGTPIA